MHNKHSHRIQSQHTPVEGKTQDITLIFTPAPNLPYIASITEQFRDKHLVPGVSERLCGGQRYSLSHHRHHLLLHLTPCHNKHISHRSKPRYRQKATVVCAVRLVPDGRTWNTVILYKYKHVDMLMNDVL